MLRLLRMIRQDTETNESSIIGHSLRPLPGSTILILQLNHHHLSGKMTRLGSNRWGHPTTLRCLTTKVAELHQLIRIASSSRKSTNKEDSTIKEASNMNHEASRTPNKGDSRGHQNILQASIRKSNRIHHCIQLRDKIYKNWINRINRINCMTLKEE